MEILLISQNLDKALPLLKTLGAVAGAAILLYLILLFVRVVGNKLERKRYQAYCQKCESQGTTPISYEEYVSRRAKGEKVLWQRDSVHAQDVSVDPLSDPMTQPKMFDNHDDHHSDSTSETQNPNGIEEQDPNQASQIGDTKE